MNENGTWRELYHGALLELRPDALRQRIAAAEEAIHQRMLDLRQNDATSEEEVQELGDALRGLRVLATTECRAPDSTTPGLSHKGGVTS